MMTTTKTATDLRRLAKSEGVTNVRVRKGKGCRSGAIHFYMKIDATREDRVAAVAFLRRINAKASIGYGLTDLAELEGRFFDSITVFDFEG